MEAPEYFYGGFYRGVASPYAPEKKGSGEHFVVEDLLDFSNGEGEGEEEAVCGGDGGPMGEAAAGSSVESSVVTAVDSCSNSSSAGYDPHFSCDLVSRGLADASLSGDLCEPYDELAELEWLSNFVEESFSSEDLKKFQLISGIKSSASSETQCDISTAAANISRATTTTITTQPPFFFPETPVPGKARSKRSRAAPCNWSSRLLVLSPTSATSSADTGAIIIRSARDSVNKKAPPKPAGKKKDPLEGPTYAASDGRTCLHCATDKTPQWRTGPMGPKTLCNACGVRFKSGRLVPEYRPAASPTFMLSKHSNSHRKVLELRRQNESQLQHHHYHQHPLNAAGSGNDEYDCPVGSGEEFLIHQRIGPDFRPLI